MADITEVLPFDLSSPQQKRSRWENRDVAYEVAIAGMPFLSAASQSFPLRRGMAEAQKQQVSMSDEPGDNSFSTWWSSSQLSFEGGAGNMLLNKEDDTNLRPWTRFRRSLGVSCWEPDEGVRLLNQCVKVADGEGRVVTSGAGSATFASDNSLTRVYGDGTVTGHTVTGPRVSDVAMLGGRLMLAQGRTVTTPKTGESSTRIKGGNVSAWAGSGVGYVDAVNEEVDKWGLNTVTIPVNIVAFDINDDTPYVDPTSLYRAHQIYDNLPDDVTVIIEPYPWIDEGNQSETLWAPTSVPTWFSYWQTACETLLSEFPDAWGMYVASNLVNLESYDSEWGDLMADLRVINPDIQLIYRTNWWTTAVWDAPSTAAFQAKVDNPVFSHPDIIAVAAYFELTDTPDPSLSELVSSIRSTRVFDRRQDIYEECERLSLEWGKPILFGELNCPAVNEGAHHPWDPDVTSVSNTDIQRRLLQAYVEVFSDADWWLGFSIFSVGHPLADYDYRLRPSAARYMGDLWTEVGDDWVPDAGPVRLRTRWDDAPGAVSNLWSVKQRLLAAVGADLYELGSESVTSWPDTPLVSGPSGWTWTGVAETPDAILLAGHDNARSSVFALTVDQATGGLPELSAPVVVADMPPGELLTSLSSYLGSIVVLGTTRGARVGRIGDQGQLQYGPLTVEGTTVRGVAFLDRFAWVTVEGSHEDGGSGLARIDVSNQMDEAGRFAWADDLRCASADRVDAVAPIGTSGLMCVATDLGFYVEQADTPEPEGWIESSQIMFHTLVPKWFEDIQVRGLVHGGSITVSSVSQLEAVTPLATMGSANEGTLEAAVGPQGATVRFGFRFTLRSTAGVSPQFASYRVRALPAFPREELLVLPLLCYDEESDRFGVRGQAGRALDRYRALRDEVADGARVLVQDLVTGENMLAVVEDMRFEQRKPPQRAVASGFGGVLTVTLRSMR